jgi:hypothetical protein
LACVDNWSLCNVDELQYTLQLLFVHSHVTTTFDISKRVEKMEGLGGGKRKEKRGKRKEEREKRKEERGKRKEEEMLRRGNRK